jgi:hypothetical protein
MGDQVVLAVRLDSNIFDPRNRPAVLVLHHPSNQVLEPDLTGRHR